MDKKILLISQGAVFMVDALAKNLKNLGFEIISAAPDITELDILKATADIVILFAEKYVYTSADVLVFLKDICIATSKPLCIIGYDKEIEEIQQSIPESVITKTITRPFDMRRTVEDIQTAIESGVLAHQGEEILLVDDDGAFLKMMQGWLSLKYRVTIVNSGMQAITYLAVHRPDLILLDFDMPITPGPQVLEMIRSAEHTADIPVIFLTGKSDRESVQSVLRLKPDGYLLKTMGKEEIVSSVDHFFETKKWKTE